MALEETINMELSERKKKGIKQAIYLSDVHVPFHDKNAQKSIKYFLNEQQPDYLIFGGDIVDFYSVSKFDKDPERKFTLMDEIVLGRQYLSMMKQAAGEQAKLYFLEGNHEHRMKKYLQRNPELASLDVLDTPALLRLKEISASYVPYDKGIIIHGFLFKHGTRANLHAAKSEVELENISGMSGHIHRSQRFGKTDRQGQHVWHSVGHLSDPEQIDYVTQQTPNWQQGFGVVQFNTRNGIVEVRQPIIERGGKFVFEGNLYTPRGVSK